MRTPWGRTGGVWQWYDPGRGTRWCYDDEPEDEAAEEGEEREEAVVCRRPCIAELAGEPLSRVKMKREKMRREKKRRKKKRKSRRRRKKKEERDPMKPKD